MRLSKTLTIAVPLAALIALAMSGCGGGGGESTASMPATTETTALSKAQLISQGDAICAEVNAAVGSVGTSEAEVPRQVTQVSDLYIGMVDSIKRLGTPSEAAGYPAFIAAAEELSKVEGEAKLAAEREDSAALGEAATKAAPALEEFESMAGEYGFEHCSEGPRAPTPSGSAASETHAEEEGGVEVAPEVTPEVEVEEAAPEEAAPETGGAGGGAEGAAPEGGGTGSGSGGGSSGGVGPG
ncbi:MAG TPA: hypothetical protein VKG03_03285 [Solirubrobacterales bacterium]|nr:hypothetical protein [Solirubrobacterales bacterium]